MDGGPYGYTDGTDCVDDLAWMGPFGDCLTYADPTLNGGYCDYDEACEPCGCSCAEECGATGSGEGSGSGQGSGYYVDGVPAYMDGGPYGYMDGGSAYMTTPPPHDGGPYGYMDGGAYMDGASCVDDLAWMGPHGDCLTYADPTLNGGYCVYDEACEPCGCSCAEECGATGSGEGSGSGQGSGSAGGSGLPPGYMLGINTSSLIINGQPCPPDAILVENNDCLAGAPHFDPEGMVCANDGTPSEAYCSYHVGPSACARCLQTASTASGTGSGSLPDYMLDDGASGSGADGFGSGAGSYGDGEWSQGTRVCDAAMCRTTDGSDGFDCWADGVWEQFECAHGYQAVLTGASWLDEYSSTELYEITCCRREKVGASAPFPDNLLKFVEGSLKHCATGASWADLAYSPAFRQRYRTGGLGSQMVPGQFHVWLCDRLDPCVPHGSVDMMCYAYNEISHTFLPLNLNSKIKFVKRRHVPSVD